MPRVVQTRATGGPGEPAGQVGRDRSRGAPDVPEVRRRADAEGHGVAAVPRHGVEAEPAGRGSEAVHVPGDRVVDQQSVEHRFATGPRTGETEDSPAVGREVLELEAAGDVEEVIGAGAGGYPDRSRAVTRPRAAVGRDHHREPTRWRVTCPGQPGAGRIHRRGQPALDRRRVGEARRRCPVRRVAAHRSERRHGGGDHQRGADPAAARTTSPVCPEARGCRAPGCLLGEVGEPLVQRGHGPSWCVAHCYAMSGPKGGGSRRFVPVQAFRRFLSTYCMIPPLR